uniref:t-SNARE coiled-coil homology domain-containing protein n=1 Tax=Gouania willdenowi TaxID=441366 RepID=A0A8C5GYR5_GOUWI
TIMLLINHVQLQLNYDYSDQHFFQLQLNYNLFFYFFILSSESRLQLCSQLLKFSDVMRDYHQAQVSFRDKCKAQIQRKLEIVDKTISNEEMEEMLHCDDLTLFISDAHISKRALTEIESRHRDIICLESSIKELQEVFADTAMLLETQGDLINNIEKNVSKAAEYVEVSRAETNKAVQYKKHWYKIASIPSFLKPLRRQSSVKTAAGHNSEVKTSK